MTIAPTPARTAIDELRDSVAGAVLTSDDAGYDEARLAWNRRLEHHPAVIVVAERADDVAQAARYARSAGLGIAVQATGHGVTTVADDALLIDMSRLTDVTVDVDRREARVGGGATWKPVLEAAQAVGLAPLLGSTSGVGAVGYTLGGGLGWLARKHGLSIDHVRSFELVTPRGELRTASAEEDPELFWALRGGGAGGLGIVTAMTIELVPVTTVYAGNLLYPASMAAAVMARYRDWVADAPDELTSSVVLMNFPPFEEVPEPIRGQSFVIVRGCWCGDLDAGEELMRSWREWAEPALDMFGPLPFSAADTISNDPVDPLPAAHTTEWLSALSDEAIDVIVDATLAEGGPPPLLFAEVRHVGGAVSRGSGTAYGNRDATLLLQAVAITPTPEIAQMAQAHLAALREHIAPHTYGGAYLNFIDGEEKRARTREGFSAAAFARLQAVKRRLDPDGAMSFGLDLSGD